MVHMQQVFSTDIQDDGRGHEICIINIVPFGL